MRLPAGFHLVAWREVSRDGPYVFMRRGTGDVGWWHAHEGEDDYGGNPMDRSDLGGVVCRTCGVAYRPSSREGK